MVQKQNNIKILLSLCFFFFPGTSGICAVPEGILLSKVSLCFLFCIVDNRTYHFQAEDEQDYVA